MRLIAKAVILCVVVLWGGAGAAGAAEIILYDFFDFGGQSVTLTESTPDLRDYNFDNDLESFRVISGTWSIHRDANYQDNSGPSLNVGPGDYPKIEALGYPQDRMSSVRLIGEPAAASCPAPYQVPNASGQGCSFACASGTVPDGPSGQCVCRRNYVQTGTDGEGRRICGPRQVEQTETPVLQLACRENSVRHPKGSCVCVLGTTQTGVDQQGRPICLRTRVETDGGSEGPIVVQPGVIVPPRQEYAVDGLSAINRARANGFRFSATPTKSLGGYGGYCELNGPVARAVYRPTGGVGSLFEAECYWRLFDNRYLADGWRLIEMRFFGSGVEDWTFADAAGLDLPIFLDSRASRPFKSVTMTLGSITLEGPAGRGWWDAFACSPRCPD